MKKLIVDAICGRGIPSLFLGSETERMGLGRFTGDQYNPEYSWDRKALVACTQDDLQALYEALRENAGEPLIKDEEPSEVILCQ
jgi:hypothetical protein